MDDVWYPFNIACHLGPLYEMYVGPLRPFLYQNASFNFLEMVYKTRNSIHIYNN